MADTDREALARLLYLHADREGVDERQRAWDGPTIPEGMKQRRRLQADALLASAWLAERDRRIRAEVADSVRGVLDDTAGSGGYVVTGMVRALLDNIDPTGPPP